MIHLLEFASFQKINIRKPTPEELSFFRDNISTGSAAEQNLVDIIPDTGENAIAAFLNNQMVGVCCYTLEEKSTKIDLLIVSPEHYHQGIGQQLCMYVIEKDPTGIVSTNPYTSESEEFFTHIGFILDEEFDQSDPNTLIYIKSKI